MRNSFILILTFFVSTAFAQNASYLPLNNDVYHMIDRLEVLDDSLYQTIHTSCKPYRRSDLEKTLNSSSGESAYDIYLMNEINPDSSKKTFLKHFYHNQRDFYDVQTDGFQLSVNPVFYGQFGRESADDVRTFINTRGIQLHGSIDDKVSFYTFLAENQMTMPAYGRNRVFQYSAIPNEAFWKTFKTDGLDFFTARGAINFNVTKHIGIQFGHDKNFIGNGYRSLILSDYGPQYLFGKIQTNVWKLQYTNIFAQLNADVFTAGGVPTSGLYPQKYMSFHHLSVNITKNFNVGLFESIMAYRGDSTSAGGLELNYLNPIIFYRSVEQNVGSQDNALLGMDFKLNFKKHFSLYGQIVLDEFLLSEVRSGNGWWANKQAGQIGLKYINAFGVKSLDLQAEANVVRPYTYTHNERETSYTHYNQPLAHPYGANFTELIGIVRYAPKPKLFLTGKLFLTRFGADTSGSNWGGNLLLENTTREQEYGNTIAQGVTTNLMFADFTISYMFKHNLFIDFKQVLRREDSEIDALDNNTSFTSISLRWNIPQRLFEY